MNVLEHFIKEIHSVRDITEEFEQHSGHEPAEPLLQVDLTYDCYGIITREIKTFWKSDFEQAKKVMEYISSHLGGYFCGDTDDFQPEIRAEG